MKRIRDVKINLLIMLLAGTMMLASCVERSADEVNIEGRKVSLKSGRHRLTAELIGEESSGTFLILGGSGRGLFPFTAHFSVMSIGNVARLEREFGGFSKSQWEGVLESNAVSMFLYAKNPQVAADLKDIDELAMAWNYPIVHMKYIEMKLQKQTANFLGRDVGIDSSDHQPIYLVTSVSMVTSNYSASR